MSDKELVLDLIQKLPEDTPLQKISQEIAFLAGLRQAEEQADRGEFVDHDRIKEDLETWLSN